MDLKESNIIMNLIGIYAILFLFYEPMNNILKRLVSIEGGQPTSSEFYNVFIGEPMAMLFNVTMLLLFSFIFSYITTKIIKYIEKILIEIR